MSEQGMQLQYLVPQQGRKYIADSLGFFSASYSFLLNKIIRSGPHDTHWQPMVKASKQSAITSTSESILKGFHIRFTNTTLSLHANLVIMLKSFPPIK